MQTMASEPESSIISSTINLVSASLLRKPKKIQSLPSINFRYPREEEDEAWYSSSGFRLYYCAYYLYSGPASSNVWNHLKKSY